MQVGLKRKRAYDADDAAKGVARARMFLREFSSLPLEQMDIKVALESVGKMRCDLEKDAADCCWLQQFF